MVGADGLMREGQLISPTPQSQPRSAGANQRPLSSPHGGTDVKFDHPKFDRGPRVSRFSPIREHCVPGEP